MSKEFSTVMPSNGKSQLLWIRPGEALPTQLSALVAKEGLDPTVISFGGGNDGLPEELKAGMPAYFSTAFKGFSGTAISGGTGKFDEARVLKSFEITQVPALLASENHCAAVGSTPLTGVPYLGQNHGNVMTDDWGGQIDPRHHANLVVANHPSDAALGWNGDLKRRVAWLEELADNDYKVAGFIFNGGNVTTEEIYHFLKMTQKGAFLIVAEGSGREADKFVSGWKSGTFEETDAKGKPVDAAVVALRQQIRKDAVRERVLIVPANNPHLTRHTLIVNGLLKQACCGGGCEIG
jgi:hypothetical protein